MKKAIKFSAMILFVGLGSTAFAQQNCAAAAGAAAIKDGTAAGVGAFGVTRNPTATVAVGTAVGVASGIQAYQACEKANAPAPAPRPAPSPAPSKGTGSKQK